jgi:hypothetical protein
MVISQALEKYGRGLISRTFKNKFAGPLNSKE